MSDAQFRFDEMTVKLQKTPATASGVPIMLGNRQKSMLEHLNEVSQPIRTDLTWAFAPWLVGKSYGLPDPTLLLGTLPSPLAVATGRPTVATGPTVVSGRPTAAARPLTGACRFAARHPSKTARRPSRTTGASG